MRARKSPRKPASWDQSLRPSCATFSAKSEQEVVVTVVRHDESCVHRDFGSENAAYRDRETTRGVEGGLRDDVAAIDVGPWQFVGVWAVAKRSGRNVGLSALRELSTSLWSINFGQHDRHVIGEQG